MFFNDIFYTFRFMRVKLI